MENLTNKLDNFLTTKKTIDNKNQEVCDNVTGECYTIKSKDGLVERINKKFIAEDGRQLLND